MGASRARQLLAGVETGGFGTSGEFLDPSGFFRFPSQPVPFVESILTRWKKSGLCDPSDVLILHAQSTIAKSPLGDRRVLLTPESARRGRHALPCTEHADTPGTIRHTSIHKAGADGLV